MFALCSVFVADIVVVMGAMEVVATVVAMLVEMEVESCVVVGTVVLCVPVKGLRELPAVTFSPVAFKQA